jgi:hypothetical protein
MKTKAKPDLKEQLAKNKKITRIVLLVIFWPVTVIWWIWHRPKTSRIVQGLVTAATLVVTVGFLAALGSGSGAATPQSSSPPVTQVSTSPVVTTPAKPLTTEEAIAAAGKTALGGFYSSSSFDASSGNLAYVTYDDPTPLTNNTFVRKSYAALVAAGTEVFKVNGVDSINIQARTTVIDAYGKSSLDAQVVIEMTKAEFQKFDWNGLRNLPSAENSIKSAATIYLIKPAAAKDLDHSSLYLSSSF